MRKLSALGSRNQMPQPYVPCWFILLCGIVATCAGDFAVYDADRLLKMSKRAAYGLDSKNTAQFLAVNSLCITMEILYTLDILVVIDHTSKTKWEERTLFYRPTTSSSDGGSVKNRITFIARYDEFYVDYENVYVVYYTDYETCFVLSSPNGEGCYHWKQDPYLALEPVSRKCPLQLLNTTACEAEFNDCKRFAIEGDQCMAWY
uniref:Uncharacterized protein n=1 Tax=Amblyomma americanum TaxID=6943 RepID=A0A0C9SE75_AMBAM